METIQFGRKKWQVPQSIEEMTRKQTVFVAGLFRDGMVILDFKMQAIAFFMGFKFRKFARHFSNSDIFRLSELCDFLFEEIEGIPRFKLAYFDNPVKRIGHMHGPTTMLQDVSIVEFRNSELAYQMYQETKEERYLNELCAALYRRNRKNKFADEDQERFIKIFSRVDIDVKFAFFLHYMSVRNYLPTLYKFVFRKSTGTSSEPFDWGDTIRHLGGGKFGTVDQTAEVLLHVFLKDMDEVLELKKS